jgi:lipoprotein-releasing system permease protein
MNFTIAAGIAFRSFRQNRRKGRYNSHPLLGAVLGVTLSLIPLIVVIHISEGMVQGIISRYLETESYHLQIFSYTDKSNEELLKEREAILGLPQVKHVWRERTGAGLIYSEEGRTGIEIRAVDREIWHKDKAFQTYIEVLEGNFDLEDDRNIVLGEAVAAKLKVKPGDSVKILTGKVFPNGKYVPRITPFTVRGIITSGYQEMDKLWAFIPYEKGETLLSAETSQTVLGVKTDNAYGNLNELINTIGAVSVGPNWRAYTWQSLNRSRLSSYDTTRSMLIIIMAMLVVVAVLNVSSSLVMLIVENRQSIGILKCMGASPAGIRRIYRLTGLFVGLGGALFGCLGGTLMSCYINELIGGANGIIGFFKGLFSSGQEGEVYTLLNSAYYIQTIPVELRWDSILFIGVSATLLSWISSAIPAARAAKIRPLEVIRKY